MKLTDDTRGQRRHSSYETLESEDAEDRYESLKSIERLLENDVKDIMRQRSVALPVLRIGRVNAFSRRRISMLELANARSKMINGLIPNLGETSASHKKNRRRSSLSKSAMQPKTWFDRTDSTQLKLSSTGDNDIQIEGKEIVHEPDHFPNQDVVAETEDKDFTSERQAHLMGEEHRVVHRASIHDCDFQQFLGIRYLEICNKKQNDIISVDFQSQLGLNDTTAEVPQTLKRPIIPADKPTKCSILNMKLLALARSKRRRSVPRFKDSVQAKRKIKFPPISFGNGIIGMQRRPSVHGNANEEKSKSPGYCGISSPCSVSLQMSRRGVPCHTEKRAIERYPGRLHALLSKFRDMSSTSQKVEQEHLVEKFDELGI